MYKEIEYGDYDEFLNDSDFENNENVSKLELIDEFLYFETENIISLFYNINSRFNHCSPFFLDYLEVCHLSDFIIRSLFFSKQNSNLHNNVLNLFKLTYSTELNVTYNILSEYITTVEFHDWVLFCIKYTNLSEFSN